MPDVFSFPCKKNPYTGLVRQLTKGLEDYFYFRVRLSGNNATVITTDRQEA